MQLQEKRDKINKKWQDKMDHLQIGMQAGHVLEFVEGHIQFHSTIIKQNEGCDGFCCCYRAELNANRYVQFESLFNTLQHSTQCIIVLAAVYCIVPVFWFYFVEPSAGAVPLHQHTY